MFAFAIGIDFVFYLLGCMILMILVLQSKMLCCEMYMGAFLQMRTCITAVGGLLEFFSWLWKWRKFGGHFFNVLLLFYTRNRDFPCICCKIRKCSLVLFEVYLVFKCFDANLRMLLILVWISGIDLFKTKFKILSLAFHSMMCILSCLSKLCVNFLNWMNAWYIRLGI